MPQPTRAEMVQDLDEIADTIAAITTEHYLGNADELFSAEDAVSLKAAAAELAKRCDGCRYFFQDTLGTFCEADPDVNIEVPEDGSGFCHRWEPKL